MDSPKREKVNVMQPQHDEQTLNIRNTINHANTSTSLNKNEHEVKGTSQSTDTSETCRDEESNFSPINTITPPISKSAGENLTEAAPKTFEAAVNNNEETENAAMVYADASKMSTATPTNTNPISIPKAMVNTLAITAIEDPEKMQPNSIVGEFAVPAIPDTKAINKDGGVGGTGTSAKKKRNKSSKKREDNKTRNKANSANSNNIGKGAIDGNRCQPPINVIASGSANMKASVSMTSLPPDDEKSEGRDVIKAKLNVERPYNSLKKNIERNAVNATLGVRTHCFSQSQSSTSSFANHRYSWGSGYSYSSSSLQSSATFGLGSAKDDLWAAIQTNYNYIMDTNLLDTCKETERHLADHNVANGVECEQLHCAELLGVTQRRELSWHDPKELRKWLREMEERLELAPTLSTVTTLTTAELEHCLAEHSVLYHEIVSHARVVSACIRSATEEHQGQVLLQQQQEEEQQLQSIDSGSTTIAEQTNSSLTSNEETTLPLATANEQSKHEVSGATSNSGFETAEKSSLSPGSPLVRSNTASPERAAETEITEDSLERLQNRYHLLYLKAFEVQLWLDGLLRKKSSNTSIVNAAGYIDDNDNVNCHSSDCEEDETAATEDDLNILGSGIESDLTHNSYSFGELRDCIDLVEEGNHGAEKHHLLKSADASSDDDGGWLYSSVLPPQSEEGAGACDGVEIDEKGNICITTIVIDGMQSSAVTSSSALTTTPPTANRVINDDSDKENKEARAATLSTAALTTLPVSNACAQSCDISSVPSSQNCTQIAHAEIQLTPVSTTSTAETALSAGRFKVKNFAASGSSSSYSTRSSSCSSNDLLTETTSATNTTQITQMHFQRVHRTEMELQIDANGNKSRHMTADGASSAVTTNNSHNNNNNGDVDNCNASNNNASKRDDNANHNANNNQSIVLHQPQMPQQALTSSENNQKSEMSYSVRWHPKTVIDSSNKTSMQRQQMQKIESKTVLLPPRSPFKPEKSLPSTARSDNFNPTNVTKSKLSHESIKQLVLEAEHLVRDVEALKTPNKQKQKHSVIKLSSTVKKREIAMPGPIKQRVQEWLEHQPTSSTTVQSHRNPNEELQSGVKSKAGDDCEASGEASETDSVPHPGSDTSEGLTESIATCMQTSTNSFGGNSTECFASSAEPIVSSATIHGYGSSNQSLNVKIVKRSQSRRKSERPWSVSCLSQLTTETVPTETIAPVVGNAQTGLATHSISESALDSLSPGRQRVSSSSTINVNQVKASNSKGSLKRRKTRKKKMSTSGNLGVVATNTHSVLKKSPDSGSEDTAEMPRLTQTLLMKSCESMSTQQIREITSALLCLQRGNGANLNEAATGSNKNAAQYSLEESKQHAIPQSQKDMGEGVPLMKPNFRVGSYTTAYMRNEKRLGSLAALATYMNDEEEEQQGAATPVPQKQREYTTGTEDHHSSFSETAWDNYQEKYNSENYSEGFDSDAARKLMEFGDDYRNFIDSQSDCCSSLSAANNLDSLSPPRMDSLQQADTKAITQDTIANSVDHARRRRALDLEYERRRKTLEVRRKSCQDSTDALNTRTPLISTSSSVNAITPRIGFEKANQQRKSDSTGRKLEFGMSQSAQSLRRTSESDTSTRRRKIDDRRRSSRNLDKSIKVIPATSSSSCDDSDDEKEMRNLLQQSRNRLEDTEALKIRCHLLRPEDYTEIISTCRDNIRCLEAVLRGPPGTVLSAQCAGQTKDLLAAWEDLLNWSENAASARKMQEEMIILKHSLSKLGDSGTFELLDTEPQIQVAIEALKNEKTELQNYRTNMLRLNASVHSWLTRQERRLQNAIAAEQLKNAGKVDVESLSSHTMPSDTEGEVAKCSTPAGLQGETDTVTTNINDATKKLSASIGTSTVGGNAKVLDIQTLINSENEFHKHLKNEVSGMYSAWDDADARINTQLETLTNSLLAWRQLESGLYEFQQALGHDRGTLKGLEGALDKGQTTPVELAQNVKVVAKLLSERVNVSEEQLTAVREHLDPNHILHIAKFTASNGSLSDSGISDGGATSDGGLSERERRLGVLRRLVKQLELALAPGSEAMKSIAVRMESAEAELKNLQNTCRDLIVRTAATHQNKKMQQQLQKTEAQQLLVPVTEIGVKGTESAKSNGNAFGKKGSPTHDQNSAAMPSKAASTRNGRQKKQNKRPSGSDNNLDNNNDSNTNNASDASEVRRYLSAAAPDSGDPADDPDLEFDLDTADKKNDKLPHNSWAWRIAKAAVPMQLALITFLCAACLMQPNCCDNLNNLSMSFTPQLRYIRGPPPI
ncbi:serine-rich adhesin for platelets isoform X3 [Bactrocera tryoni]|uniref:serine-rich adhesin for platelets isoform X3 n=1 Tax=Bactrocera tryoni TaxID=59916 RepID=UPI001A9A16AD|nr:serine-rich adhesin for platelets isoform X3 [Bactrocera tryoni]